MHVPTGWMRRSFVAALVTVAVAASGAPAVAATESSQNEGWTYSTRYLYSNTRYVSRLDEHDLNPALKYAALPAVAVLDTLLLPLDLATGLLGEPEYTYY